MLKNKKGFTLIEILAAITVLGILMGIAILSVTKVIENGKKKHYTTAEANMVLAGQSYVQQNRTQLPKAIGQKKKIPMSMLVDKNYIQPIKDYSDNECNMAESYIQVYKYSQNDYSYVSYLECPNYNSQENINGMTPEITASIEIDKDNSKANAKITITGNDKLMSYSYIIYRNSKEVKNTGSVAVNDFAESKSFNFSLAEYTPGDIKLVITATNTYGNTKTKTVTENVPDSQKPKCVYLNAADKTDKAWTSENRKITVGCDDGETGSGCTREEFSKTFKSTVDYDYVTIEDESGNTTQCRVSVFVDKTKPSCTNSGDSTKWTNSNRTINWGCSDSQSGCNASYSGGSTSFTTTTKTATIAAYTIKDNVGNTRTCAARTANVYVDKTPPTCTVTGGNASWTNSSRTIKASCADVDSKCDTADFEKKYDTNINTTTAGAVGNNSGGSVKDKAGNVTQCAANQTVKVDISSPTVSSVSNPKDGVATIPGLQVTLTGSDTGGSGISKWQYKEGTGSWTNIANSNYSPYVDTFNALRDTTTFSYRLCDVAGNCSSSKSTSVKIVDACSSTTTTWTEVWGNCSKACGTGTQTMSGTKYSNYDGRDCGADSKSQSCNTQGCCDSTVPNTCTAWTWTGCTASCGSSGTQYQTRTCTLKSAYDGSTCSGSVTQTANEGTACNRVGCCDWTWTDWGDWGGCDVTCGAGTQYRSGTKYSHYNGQNCGADSDSQACDAGSCAPPPHDHDWSCRDSASAYSVGFSWDCTAGHKGHTTATRITCCICGVTKDFSAKLWCPNNTSPPVFAG